MRNPLAGGKKRGDRWTIFANPYDADDDEISRVAPHILYSLGLEIVRLLSLKSSRYMKNEYLVADMVRRQRTAPVCPIAGDREPWTTLNHRDAPSIDVHFRAKC